MKKRIDISPSNRKLKLSEKADQLPVIHYIYCVHRHHSQKVPTTTLLNKDVIMKLDNIKKFAILKNGIGIKGQKVHKQVRDQRNGAQMLLEIENKS